MFFKSYDGWQQFESQSGKTLIMAFFTKADEATVCYNTGSLADKIRKRPPAMTENDLGLMQTALDQQIEFVQSYIHEEIKGRIASDFSRVSNSGNMDRRIPPSASNAKPSLAMHASHH